MQAVVTLSGTLIPGLLEHHHRGGWMIFVSIMTGLDVVSAVYMFAGLVVLSCLCWMGSLILRDLNGQIAAASSSAPTNPQQLDRWRDRYHVISDLVEAINRSFGFILLVTTAFLFIWLVNSAFYTLKGFRDPDGPSVGTFINLGFGVVAFVCYAVMVWISQSLRNQVIDL